MLPDFTRVAWSSTHAQAVWSERVRSICAAWDQIERLSVLDGLRSSALQSIAPDVLPGLVQWAATCGLVVVPLEQTGVSQSYTSSRVAVEPGQPWAYRVVTATPGAAALWPRAWRESDDDIIGRLLGFPECCRSFFARTWGAGLVDTTLEMGEPHQGPREVNILLRWLGVRAVTHLPCSFACEPSESIGREMVACGRRHGFSQEMDWLEGMLDWPIEWSALHGIAEIVTPVCRIQTRTNHTAEKRAIRRHGHNYPDEGSVGVRFPFRSQSAATVTVKAQDPREWTDNGFSSLTTMNAAHSRLLSALGSRVWDTVLDLGCGNGRLLTKIPAKRRVGVESDPDRAARAGSRIDRVIVGDCTDIALLDAVIREEQPSLILAQTRRNPDIPSSLTVLSYSYDEPSFVRLVEPSEVAA